MFIGESHYYEPSEGGISFIKHQNPDYTRIVIRDVAIGREYKTYPNHGAKIFPNLHLTIFGNDTFDTSLLWDNVCFYNFIQDPMNTKKGRPKATDFQKGWNVFSEVIHILQPSTCIFLGNSCAKYFPRIFSQDIVVQENLCDDGWVNSTASKKAQLKLSNGQLVKLKFIKHPSKFYSWSQWRTHFKEKQLVALEE